MGMVMSGSPSGYAEGFVHCDECKEAHHDSDAQEEIAVRLDHDKANTVWRVFTQEDLREQVEDGVTQEAADRECDHNGQGGGVDVWGA